MSSLEATRAYWDENVTNWKVATQDHDSLGFFEELEQYRFEKLHYLPQLVDYNAYAGKKVLDVGCGLGNDTSRFAKGGAEITGVDISSKAVAMSKRNFELRGLTGTFEQMDGGSLDFPDNSFDLVYCHTVLHFAYNPEAIVKEIKRVLKPDGQAIIMTVNRKGWLMVMHKLMGVEIDYLDSPVFHPYSIPEFERLLSPFSKVDIVPERFPVRTVVHKGLKSTIYNLVFVDLFNLMPRALTRRTGYHLMAFVSK